MWLVLPHPIFASVPGSAIGRLQTQTHQSGEGRLLKCSPRKSAIPLARNLKRHAECRSPNVSLYINTDRD
jgi:hypothetical protein